jgi:hypothetical protein
MSAAASAWRSGNAKAGASAAGSTRFAVDPQAELGAPRRVAHAATLDQFQRCQAQLRAAIGLGFRQAIDELIVADLLEPLQRKRRPRAIAQQPLQAGAVGALDAHRSIQRKRSDSDVSVQANAGVAGVKRSGRS